MRGTTRKGPRAALPPAAARLQPGQPPQQRPHVRRAAGAEIAEQQLQLGGRQRRRLASAADRRGPPRAAPRARCPAPAPQRTAARRHSATSRARRAGAPRRPSPSRPPCRPRGRPTSGWRRSRRLARRRLGSASLPARHARASAPRSLSVKDATTISPGVWPRSTGSTRSSSVALVVVRMCMAGRRFLRSVIPAAAKRRAGIVGGRASRDPGYGLRPFRDDDNPQTASSAPSAALHRGTIQPLQPDHHQPAGPLPGTPGAVILVRHPRPDRLHQQPHRLAGHRDEALHPQRARPPRRHARCGQESSAGSETSGTFMTKLSKSSWSWSSSSSWWVRRFSMSASVPTPRPSSTAGSSRPATALTTRTARGRLASSAAFARSAPARSIEVALGQHHEIGAGHLVLEHFLDRIVMVERGVAGPLRRPAHRDRWRRGQRPAPRRPPPRPRRRRSPGS